MVDRTTARRRDVAIGRRRRTALDISSTSCHHVVMTSPRITQLPRSLLVEAVAAAAIGDYIAISVDETDNSTDCTGRVGIVGADPSVGVIVSTTIDTMCDVVSPPSPARRVVTVPTRQLVAELKGCGSGDVINLVVTAASLQLSCGSRRSDIAALGRVPTMATVPPQAWRNVGMSGCVVLSMALAAVLPAAADDPSRPAVSGVRIDGGDVVATDGARLHWVAGGIVGGTGDGVGDIWPALTLPVGAVGPIVDLLSDAIAASTPPKPAMVKRGKAAAAATTAVPPPPAPVVSLAVGVHNVAVRSCHDATSSTLTSTTTLHRVTRAVYVRRAPEPYAEWRRIVAVDAATPDAAATGVVSVTLSATSLSSWLRSCPGDAVTLTVEDAADGAASVATPMLRLDYVVTDPTGTRCVGSGSDTLPLGGATGSGAATSTTPKVSTRYLRDVVVAASAVGGDVVSMSWSGTSQLLRVTSGPAGSAGLCFVGVVMWMR